MSFDGTLPYQTNSFSSLSANSGGPFGGALSNWSTAVPSDYAQVGTNIGAGVASGLINYYVRDQGAFRSTVKGFLGATGNGGLAEAGDFVQQTANKLLGTKEHSWWNDTLQYGPLVGPIKHALE